MPAARENRPVNALLNMKFCMVSFLGQQRIEKVKFVASFVDLEDSLFVLLFAVKGIAKPYT